MRHDRLTVRRSVVCAAVVAGLAAILVGCTGTAGSTHSAASHTSPSSVHSPVHGSCPASPIVSTSAGPEVRGTGHGASLFGLIMVTTPLPIRAGEDVKIVWRMTGQGSLRLGVTSPTGRAVHPTWGPELHSGSNYDRPGEEWGAGYRFAQPGCWRLETVRTRGSADVWLRVAAG